MFTGRLRSEIPSALVSRCLGGVFIVCYFIQYAFTPFNLVT